MRAFQRSSGSILASTHLPSLQREVSLELVHNTLLSSPQDNFMCGCAEGDQAAHLLWRLQHGEVFLRHDPQLIFVMIGTNDLGASQCLGGEKAILEAAPGSAERFVAQKLCIHIWMLQHLCSVGSRHQFSLYLVPSHSGSNIGTGESHHLSAFDSTRSDPTGSCHVTKHVCATSSYLPCTCIHTLLENGVV